MSETPKERLPDGLHQLTRHSTGDSDGYDVVGGDLPKPVLSGVVSVAPDLDSLIELIAADLFVHAERSLISCSEFHMALTVGPIQLRLYERLMCDVTLRSFPWSRTHIWMAAQRVDVDDYQEVRERLVFHSDIPAANVHPWKPVDDDPPGHTYEALLKSKLVERPAAMQRMDYAILGLQADGGVAAITPTSEVAHDRHAGLVEGPDGQRWLTLGLDILSQARLISVVAAGKAMAPTVELVRAMTASGAEDLPILGISAMSGGHLKWYLDREACPSEDSA